MFSNFSWTEMLVIACVAIIVVGPKDLPGMLRSIGKTVGSMKRMAGDFQRQFNDALKEADMDEVKNLTSTKGFSPLEDAKKSMEEFARTMESPATAPSDEVEAPAVVENEIEAPAVAAPAKSATSKTTTKKPATKKPAAKPTAGKTGTRKTTAAKKPAASKAAASKPATSKAATRKPAAKRAVTKKTAAAKQPAEAKSS